MMCKEQIQKRCISGLVLAILFLIGIFLYRPIFYILTYITSGLMLYEWYNMTKSSTSYFYDVVGQILIVTPSVSVLIISSLDINGWVLFTLFCCISTVDAMAMIGGKLIGGPKLAVKISPNKTISGLLTGVFSACICINLLTLIPNYVLPNMLHKNHVLLTLSVIFIGFLAQMSDLLISYFKRRFKVKDSGTIIPGHGGVLDRFDSIVLTTPFVLVYLISSV